MRRALQLIGIQARASALLAMQYRLDFVLQAVLGAAWILVALTPLVVLFDQRPSVAGWSWGEALIVVGFFTLLKGALDGLLQPSMTAVVDHVRKGTLDFVLLKPADGLLLISTSRFNFSALSEVLTGGVMIGWGLAKSGRSAGAADWAVALVIVGCAVAILWSVWVVAVSMSFHFVKVDNLSHLIGSTFDAARWPASVYRGAFQVLFTFVIPLAVMTTFPALAVLGRIEAGQIALAIGLAALFVTLARLTWRSALSHYTSAGG